MAKRRSRKDRSGTKPPDGDELVVESLEESDGDGDPSHDSAEAGSVRPATAEEEAALPVVEVGPTAEPGAETGSEPGAEDADRPRKKRRVAQTMIGIPLVEQITRAAAAGADAPPQAEAAVDSEAAAEAEAEADSEADSEAETAAEAAAAAETAAESAADETETETAAEAEAEAGTETAAAAEAETETEAETAAEAEAGTETAAAAAAAAEAETAAAAEAEIETETAAEAETETETEAGTEAESESEAGTEAAAESETETETAAESEAAAEAEAETVAETAAASTTSTEADEDEDEDEDDDDDLPPLPPPSRHDVLEQSSVIEMKAPDSPEFSLLERSVLVTAPVDEDAGLDEESDGLTKGQRAMRRLSPRLLGFILLLLGAAGVAGTFLTLLNPFRDWFMHLLMYCVIFTFFLLYLKAHARRRPIARYLMMIVTVGLAGFFAWILMDYIPAQKVWYARSVLWREDVTELWLPIGLLVGAAVLLLLLYCVAVARFAPRRERL